MRHQKNVTAAYNMLKVDAIRKIIEDGERTLHQALRESKARSKEPTSFDREKSGARERFQQYLLIKH